MQDGRKPWRPHPILVVFLCALAFTIWCELDHQPAAPPGPPLASVDPAGTARAVRANRERTQRREAASAPGLAAPAEPESQIGLWAEAVNERWRADGVPWRLVWIGIGSCDELVIVTDGHRPARDWQPVCAKLAREAFGQLAHVADPLPVKVVASGEPGAKVLFQCEVRRQP